MRLYLPSTQSELSAEGGLAPAEAHAVTPALADALPGEDEEGLEFAAFLAAADASVIRLAADPGAPRRRVVVVAEVAGSPAPLPGGLPSRVQPPSVIPWADVVSIHIDEAAAEADVAAAAAGDDDALERAAERDLLWFDASERDSLTPRPDPPA